jgi:membrane protein
MNWQFIWGILKDSVKHWIDDGAPRLGAAMAYYAIFSVAPFFMIVIGVAGLLFREQAARGEVFRVLENVMGQQSASAIEEIIKQSHNLTGSAWKIAFGVILALFGASGVFLQLQDALNIIWKVKPRPGRAILDVIRTRALSVAVVFCTGFLVVLSLVTTTMLEAVIRHIPHADSAGLPVWRVIHMVIAFLFLSLLFAIIFKVLPDAHVSWRNVWMGSLVTSALFALGKYVIGQYMARSGIASAFGAAGALVGILVWIYYSSQIFLFGAEFTRVHALKTQTETHPVRGATKVEHVDNAQGFAHSA